MILSFCKTETNQEWLILHVRLCVSRRREWKKRKSCFLCKNFPSLESDEDLFGEMSTTNFWVLNLCGLSQEVNGKRNDAEIKFLAAQTIYHAESCERRRNWKSLPRRELQTFCFSHTPIQRKTLRQYFPPRDSILKTNKNKLHYLPFILLRCVHRMYTRNFPEDQRQLFGGREMENKTADVCDISMKGSWSF